MSFIMQCEWNVMKLNLVWLEKGVFWLSYRNLQRKKLKGGHDLILIVTFVNDCSEDTAVSERLNKAWRHHLWTWHNRIWKPLFRIYI